MARFSIDVFLANVLTGLIVFAIGFLVFAFGWFGGGDGKLAAAGALWFGPIHAQEFILVSFIYGAALVGLMFILRRMPLPPLLLKQQWFEQWLEGKSGVPFGLAMAASVLSILN